MAIFGKDEYMDKYFQSHYYIFKYDNLIRKLLLDYKFNEKPYLYRTFSEFINKYQKLYLQLEIYDIIIPVPLSKKRKRERGYNQSLLISKEISKALKTKLEKNILIKKRNNQVQSTLNKERKRNKCCKCI